MHMPNTSLIGRKHATIKDLRTNYTVCGGCGRDASQVMLWSNAKIDDKPCCSQCEKNLKDVKPEDDLFPA